MCPSVDTISPTDTKDVKMTLDKKKWIPNRKMLILDPFLVWNLCLHESLPEASASFSVLKTFNIGHTDSR